MARSFNGSSDLINCGVSVNYPTAVTLSGWVKLSSLANAYTMMMGRIDAGGKQYRLFIKSTGKLAVYLDAGVNLDYDGTGSNTLVTGTWYHLAFVYSSVVGIIGYVNGASDATVAANGALQTVGTAPFEIGNDSGAPGRLLAGSAADVCQWNVALSAGEITALAAGARPGKIRPGNIDGWWPLDGLVSPEPDLSGNAHNGTLTGTSLATTAPPLNMLTPRWPQFLAAAAAALGIAVWPYRM